MSTPTAFPEATGTPFPEITDTLVFAVVAHTGMSFGVVANVLFGARTCIQNAQQVPAPCPQVVPERLPAPTFLDPTHDAALADALRSAFTAAA